MKKSKLAVGLMTAFLSAGVLAGCGSEVKFSSDGLILTYTDGLGKEHTVKGDELMTKYYNDSSKYQSIFDSIYSIVVRNYFTYEETVTYGGIEQKLGKSQMGQIEIDAQFKVDTDKRTAQKNADTNDTSYSDEFNAILSSKGVKDEEGLKEHYVEELQKETFDQNFYKYHVDDLKLGASDVQTEGKNFWTGYFNDMLPYHISHILVKLEDSSGTNYANGTISEDNAEKLFNVIDILGKGKYSFGSVAHRFSEDTGSAEKYGDLGIMDYSTGWVNEFKLGVYAYENLYSNDHELAAASNIALPNPSKFEAIVKQSFDEYESEKTLPLIPSSKFDELKQYAKITKDGEKGEGKAVIENSTLVYPRNVIYNKYFNRHSFAFITNEGNASGFDGGNTGYHVYTQDENKVLADYGKGILSVQIGEVYRPILAVRAGSDYQGIHFIIVDRSPFEGDEEKVVNGVTLNDYYTTYYPEQTGFYPVDDATKSPLKTYVNFESTATADTKERAETVQSTIKGFNSDKLDKYIFKKYYTKQKLHLSNESLEKALNKWIDRSLEKKVEDTTEAWNKTWNEYLDMLGKQITERNKLVSEACKIGFAKGNDDTTISSGDYNLMKGFLEGEGKSPEEIAKLIGSAAGVMKYSDLFKKEGGLCNDGKTHI